jgi:TonB-linked SusC/RagA family outer membrane protein
LKSALRSISREGDVAIFYNDRDVPISRKVSIDVSDVAVIDALRILLRGLNLNVRAIDVGLLVQRARVPEQVAPSADTSEAITGVVVDSTTGSPVAGADVTLEGTERSTRSNAQGRFEVLGIAAGEYTIAVRRLGYRRAVTHVTVYEGQVASTAIELVPVARVLDQVVTTATGEHRRVEIGNAIDVIHADSLVSVAPVTTLSEVLATRVPGLQVYFPGGLTGASPQINVRGQNSLSLTNQPLLYIDGIRVDNGAAGSTAPPVSVGPSSGRFDDLVPSEIASIEVVKGPSAATLYGTDAANGVILVRTKRGVAGPPSWSLFAEAGLLEMDRNRFRTNYFPWGHPISGDPAEIRCPLRSVAAGTCAQDSVTNFSPLLDPETTPIGTGSRYSFGAQVSGGSDVRYFLSGTMEREIGYLQMPDADRALLEAQAGHALGDEALKPNAARRYAGRANFAIPLASTADLTVGVGLNSSRLRIPSPLAIESADGGPGIRDQNDGWRGGARPGDLFIKRNRQNVTHVTTSLTGNWRPAGWASARLTAGLDRSSEFDDRLARAGEGFLPFTVVGARENTKVTTSLQTLDGSGTVDVHIGRAVTSRTTVGVQYNRRLELINTAAAKQLTPGSSTVAGGALPIASEATTETVVAGTYAEQVFGFHDRLYASIAARADGGSAFGTGFHTAFYPKASVSWLLSDEEFWPDIPGIASLRLRAAYGQSGVQPGPVAALASESLFPAFVAGVSTTGAGLGTLGNRDLKPERQRELEFGADLQALGGRVELAVTHYDKRSTDALVSLPLPASLGGGTRWENVGAVHNWGYEAAMTVALVRRAGLRWSVSLNGSVNDNEVVSIAPGVDALYTQAFPSIAQGKPLFSYFDYPITGFDDANGDGILDDTEISVGDDLAFAGRSYPRTQLSGTTEVGLLDDHLRISASIEHRGGFSLMDPEWISCNHDTCAGVSFLDAPFQDQAAAQARRAPALHNTLWGFIRDASFTRLRELSLTYSLANNLARSLGVRETSVTLSARNLALWSRYRGVDPEVQSFFGSSDMGAGYDRSGPPAPTYWLLRVQVRP